MTALSKQSPTEPIEGTRPQSIARRVNAHDVNWEESTGGRNTSMWEVVRGTTERLGSDGDGTGADAFSGTAAGLAS
jgi:hypothetical protein